MSKRITVLVWAFRSIEDFFFAFRIEYSDRFAPFFDAMGLEMMLKAYFLAERASELENLPEVEQSKAVNDIAKNLNHRLEALVRVANKSAPDNKLAELLTKDFDGYSGRKMLRALEAAYVECRYPVPRPFHEKTPLLGKDGKQVSGVYQDPISSSGVSKFAYAVGRVLLDWIREKHGIALPRAYLERIVPGDTGQRFCNLFFDGEIDRFVVGGE